MSGTILVTGATGRQGGAVARRLLAAGLPVHALTRKPDSPEAYALAAEGADIVPGDFDDPASLARALDGAAGLFAMQTPYEAGTEQEVVHGIRLADLAGAAGVRHIVYSSVASADLPTGVAHFESKGRIERHIKSLGFLRATILRPTFFMEMLLSPGNLRELDQGRIALTLSPTTRVAMIAVDDIARMSAAAFLEPETWSGRTIDLAGDLCTFVDVANAFAAALACDVTYVQVPPEVIAPDTRPKLGTQRWLEAVGWPVDLTALRSIYPFPATTIAEWARQNAAALRNGPGGLG